ncbi:hypothetical protein BH24CHL5_BH24CHL5_07090 [soil metagenome]
MERSYRIRFDEAGPDGRLRSSGFLRYASDIAWLHSEAAGFGRDWYAARRLTFLIRAIELDMIDEVTYGTSLSVSTEVIGFRRVWGRRRSEFTLDGQERPVAVALIDWVLLGEHGKPVSIPAEIAEAYIVPPGTYTPLRFELGEPPTGAARRDFDVRRSDLDPMAHVNNAAYVDFLDEHFLGDDRIGRGLTVPRRYRAEFILSAEAGSTVVGRGWQDQPAWCYRLELADGRELFRARLESDPATWVGG